MRIWKIKPGSEDLDNEGMMSDGDSEETRWTAISVADFDQHKWVVFFLVTLNPKLNLFFFFNLYPDRQ